MVFLSTSCSPNHSTKHPHTLGLGTNQIPKPWTFCLHGTLQITFTSKYKQAVIHYQRSGLCLFGLTSTLSKCLLRGQRKKQDHERRSQKNSLIRPLSQKRRSPFSSLNKYLRISHHHQVKLDFLFVSVCPLLLISHGHGIVLDLLETTWNAHQAH